MDEISCMPHQWLHRLWFKRPDCVSCRKLRHQRQQWSSSHESPRPCSLHHSKKGSTHTSIYTYKHINLEIYITFLIFLQKLQILGCWNGYRGNFTSRKKEKPSFQVKKYCRILRGDLVCEVTAGFKKYFMVSSGRKKQGFKIVNSGGDITAEVIKLTPWK